MNINYEEIDVLMRPIIKVLNDNGIKTKYCCQGHEDFSQVYISFEEEMQEKDLLFLVKLFDHSYLRENDLPNSFTIANQFQLQKWVRYSRGKVLGNWSLEIRNVLNNERKYILQEVERKLVNYFNSKEDIKE